MNLISGLSDHQIAFYSFVIAIGSLAVALASLYVAFYGILRSNKNSSAATLVTLNEGFRQGWERFLKANDDAGRQYQLSELMNLAELACALYSEKSVVGASKELLSDYLRDSLKMLLENPDACVRIRKMLDSPNTFKYVREFLESRHQL